MDSIRTIFIASDGHARARLAEARTELLCRTLHANAIKMASMRDQMEKQDATMPVAAGAADLTSSAVADPAPAMGALSIVASANDANADLIVVAPQQTGFIAGLFARFRANELIRLSERPVLLVNQTPDAPYRKVLVAVDFSAESEQAARVALALAPGAQFTFLHVFRVPQEELMLTHGVADETLHAYRVRERETARVRLNGFIDALGRRKQLMSRAIEHGHPGPVIHAHAKAINADLIVVGKHGKSRFVELFLGSVTERLIEYGDCDLLVTTSPCEEERPMPPAA